MEKKQRKKREYRSEETRAKESAHWLGKGNPICPQRTAVAQREFYKWALQTATQEELEEYVKDESKPYFRRAFIMKFKASETVGDYLNVTNQVYGMPKQTIETQELPPINCAVFGDDTGEGK